ncbi:SCO2525 family SAM-dependent methyltransferase [Streptomyces purpurascens]|uniref:SCO2525 family SAM-dependent methyltransferase n=2 Tax=Streptomyces purpurascens TaxID=1924 RepID=UPI0016792664|nr:SCO2525 family SAM-dependent methyltransferase [Streptomyces purpurascens]MCE7051699.1 SCO2525 family SAM-dependent methyltransferase [Streptomyces purpurascens]
MTSRSSWNTRNSDVAWAKFDPIAYVDHNYRCIQEDDAEILRIVRDHFADHFRTTDTTGPVSGIDVGSGPNLYPALAMLPWCEEITLLEYSPANVRYLEGQVMSYDANWDQFWDVLREHEAYRSLGMGPRDRFCRAVEVKEGDLFDLARHEGRWSLGTMFFVAESMTSSRPEFRLGVERFLRALTPGAPFAAAFMEHSMGHHAGEHFFPACDVGEPEVQASLDAFAIDVTVVRPQSHAQVRDGYSGMILACGRRR